MKPSLLHLLCFSLSASIGLGQPVISEKDNALADVPAAAEEVPTPAPAATAPAPAPGEAAIPVAYPVARYETSWKKNPFLLKTTPIVQATVSFADDWSLAGMFNNAGKIRVSIQNKQTGELKHLTNEPKEGDEFRLVKANFNRNRTEASAEIAKGSETATLKYDESMTSRPVTINNTAQRPVAGAAPGQPGGAPVRPGQPGVGGVPGHPIVPGQTGGVQAMVTNPATGRPMAGSSVAVQPGQPVMSNQAGQPGAPFPATPGVPPTISRRRQLIPAPVIQPQQ